MLSVGADNARGVFDQDFSPGVAAKHFRSIANPARNQLLPFLSSIDDITFPVTSY
jgi:hypothetical protein